MFNIYDIRETLKCAMCNAKKLILWVYRNFQLIAILFSSSYLDTFVDL